MGTHRKMDRSKASMARSTQEVTKRIFPLGRRGRIFQAGSILVLPGIPMPGRMMFRLTGTAALPSPQTAIRSTEQAVSFMSMTKHSTAAALSWQAGVSPAPNVF